MTAPVEQQRESVNHCLARLAEALGLNPGFDWPCDCGKPGSQCTKKEDGNCG